MKKYSKKEKLVILVRILTAALIAGLLWTVIYFIAPVKASAAGSYMCAAPDTVNIYGNGTILSYQWTTINDSISHNEYIYIIYRCNYDGNYTLFNNASSISTGSLLTNSQYTFVSVYSGWLDTFIQPIIQYKNGSTVSESDLEIVELVYGFNESEIIDYCTAFVNGLNISTDYASYLRSVSYNGITDLYDFYAANAAVPYYHDIYIDTSTFVTFNGSCALNNGISHYSVEFNNIVDNSSNVSVIMSNSNVLDDFIAQNNLSISNYSGGAGFNITLNLLDYVGQDVQVKIYAYSNVDQNALIIYAANLHVYEDPDPDPEPEPEPGPTPPGTETDTSHETDTDVTEPDIQGSYLDGYAAGFAAASQLNADGVFKNGTLIVTFTSVPPATMPNATESVVTLTLDPGSYQSVSSLNFKTVWLAWTRTPQYTNGNELLSVSIRYFFGTPFSYQSNLLSFSGDASSNPNSYTLPTVFLFDIYGKAFSTTLSHDNSALYNRLYLSTDYLVGNDLYSIQIDIPFRRTIQFWLNEYQLTLNVPKDVVAFNEVSFNKGQAVGFDAGEKVGFQAGKEAGEKVATDKAYSDGKADGYDEGKLAGIKEEQSNELRQDFKWYDMFFSMFDAQVNVFRSVVNFEIFGVNVAGFVLGLVTIGIIAFIIRKVW